MPVPRLVLSILLGLCLLACRSTGTSQPTPRPTELPHANRPQVVYQVFVRSFQDSNGDGKGDLQGIMDRLDHLNDGRPGEGQDLEVDGLWLTPIHPSPSYHGYDVTDHLDVHPDFGTVQTATTLFNACRERGITVILDLVANHTSSKHPWFLSAVSNPHGEYRNYYVWRADNPGWTQPWSSGRTWHEIPGGPFYYGLFYHGMPDLNFAEPRVGQTMIDIGRTWLERGAGGFRMDAVRYLHERADGQVADLPETHAYLKRFRSEMEKANPRALLVAEVWSNPTDIAGYWGEGREFHQAFDFPLASAIKDAVIAGHAPILVDAWNAREATGTPWEFGATFLSNHDMERLASKLPGDEAVKAAWTILMMLPGTPYIYYGDEIGMLQGEGRGDEAKRTPMAWTPSGGFSSAAPWHPASTGADIRNVQTQQSNPHSIFQHVRRLIALRRQHGTTIHHSPLTFVDTGVPSVLAILRGSVKRWVLAIINLDSTPAPLSPLHLPMIAPRDETTPPRILMGHALGRLHQATLHFHEGQQTLAPHESRILAWP